MTYKDNPVVRVEHRAGGRDLPRIIHDNGAIATFSDGTVVNRQHRTVHQRNGVIMLNATPHESEHVRIAGYGR